MTLQFVTPSLVDTGDRGPDSDRAPSRTDRLVTSLIVGLPTLGVLVAIYQLWGGGLSLLTIALAVGFFLVTGHGITIGYHRLLTHKSFVATRSLKLALVALGSMAFEGGPVGWVAGHRQHHVFSDQPGDPHSPRRSGGSSSRLKGLWHAHIGWLFTFRASSRRQHAADLLADRDMVVMNALFPVFCVVSLALPFGLGWFVGGTLADALEALLWAGLVRVFVLHQATWGINSLCHMFGRRPFETGDRSTNLRWMAMISMGESWHNAHHAFPRSARHGMMPHQLDSSWLLIQAFERAGWAHSVYSPTPAAISAGCGRNVEPWTSGPIYQRTSDS